MRTSSVIDIPSSVANDRATRRLVTAWLHHHSRVAVCSTRVSWKSPTARKIEKKRRKEKWQRIAQILEIQRTLLLWLGDATEHPDLWTPESIDAPESHLRQLERAYAANKRYVHHLAGGTARTHGMKARAKIVATRRAIERKWMVALVLAIDPDTRIPPPLKLHPRELLPRKIARATKALLADVSSH